MLGGELILELKCFADVKYVSSNREKGYAKGLEAMAQRCEPLVEYEGTLLASQQAFQRRCLEELKGQRAQGRG